ncbi:MAG: FAD-dependent oxidoreductase [Myxococcota bacterium]
MTHYRPRVGIIGAGISGLSCATTLVEHGVDVRVADKGRGPGGRMSTRRVPPLDNATFDHGAQYFTARSEAMRAAVAAWQREGVVAEWLGEIVSIGANRAPVPSKGTTRFVGTPTMSAICSHLAEPLDVRLQCRVTSVTRDGERWQLTHDEGETLGPFDALLCTAPPKQTVELLESWAPDVAAGVASVAMDPCWAVMMAAPAPVDVPFDGAFINDGPLSWAARTSAKPERMTTPDRWVLHGSARWSNSHLEADANEVVAPLVEAFFAATRAPRVEPSWAVAHRWRYAIAANPLDEGFLFDPSSRIGACGDWANGNRIEGAWTSGRRAAHAILEALGVTRQSDSTSGASNI